MTIRNQTKEEIDLKRQELMQQLYAAKVQKAELLQEDARVKRNRLEKRALDHFASFVKLMWPVVEPNPLEWGPHMDVVCNALEDVAKGRCKRLIINIPPGFSKSLLVSVMYPAWRWLRKPTLRSLYLSNGESLARRDSKRTRDLLHSPEYERLKELSGSKWGFSKDQNEVLNFENTMHGFRHCASLGSAITGKRADDMVIDDPIDAKDAIEGAPERIAERMMEVNTSIDQVLTTRLNDQRYGSIIVIMQRLHEIDLTGHLLKQGGWRHVCLPMRYDKDISSPEDWRTKHGELLDERRFPEDIVKNMEERLGSQASGQFQQRPVSPTGGLFPTSIWQYVDVRSYPKRFEREAAGWDLAFGASEGGAYHAGIFGGLYQGKLYVIPSGIIHIRCEINVLTDTMRDLRKKKFPRATAWYMEDKAGARPARTALQSEIPGIVPVQPDGDKVSRAQSWQPYAASGNIILPCTCGRGDPHQHIELATIPADPIVVGFVAEHASFPKGALKDRVDAMGYLVRGVFDAINKVDPDAFLNGAAKAFGITVRKL